MSGDCQLGASGALREVWAVQVQGVEGVGGPCLCVMNTGEQIVELGDIYRKHTPLSSTASLATCPWVIVPLLRALTH